MIRFVARRLASSAVVLAGVSVITFVLARFVPSDVAAIYIGPRARPEQIERVREQLGLNDDLATQYLVYMRDMLGGDWGSSISTKRPVLDEILLRLPATLELIVAAMLIALPLGLVLGMLSARWQGRPVDVGVRIVSIIGVSLPAFFLGLLLQILFFRTLDVLPLSGRVDFGPPLRQSHHLDHRRLHRRRGRDRQLVRTRGRGLAPHPAGHHAGGLSHRAHLAHDPLGHARIAGQGLHPHGARLRPA